MSGGHANSRPSDLKAPDSQRFHVNSQLGCDTGRSLGKGRVMSIVSQK